MSLNRWLAERYTPTDVLALGGVSSAVLVGTVALAQGIEIVRGTEAIGLFVSGAVFLVGFGAGVAYLNQKNHESFHGTVLNVLFDNENGQVVLDGELAIKVRAFPDGPIGDSVTSFDNEVLGDGAHGWYVQDDSGDEEFYLELSLGEVANV